MSAFVTIAIVALVIVYFRMNTRARRRWLRQLDLVGQWHWEQGDGSLVLSGRLDKGMVVRTDSGVQQSGRWRLEGHTLFLFFTDAPKDAPERYDVRLFKPGQIGLEDDSGKRRIYLKSSQNVVVLRNPKGVH